MNEALRTGSPTSTTPSTSLAPWQGHPYPAMVRDFQAVIGHETRAQMLEKQGRLPIADCLRGRRLQRDGTVLSVHQR